MWGNYNSKFQADWKQFSDQEGKHNDLGKKNSGQSSHLNVCIIGTDSS